MPIEHDERKTRREERWMRSPEWRQAVFSAAVIFVDGGTELGTLPEGYATMFSTPFEATGAMVFSIGGKPNLAYHLAATRVFGIPRIVLERSEVTLGIAWQAQASCPRAAPRPRRRGGSLIKWQHVGAAACPSDL
jgi:hypothetical protein